MKGREMEDLIETYKALADETRLRILGLVADRPHTGWQLAEALRISQPVVSHHVEKLKRAALLREVREGKERVYGLNRDTLTRLARERVAIQPVHSLLAFAHLAQERGALELFDVVGNDRLGDAQRFRELPPGVRPVGDEPQ